MAAKVSIETPRGGFTTSRIQTISGRVDDFSGSRANLIVNGIPQEVPLSRGRFHVDIVVAPGENLVEVRAGEASDRVSFFAKVPPRDIKIVLTWDTPTDVDLWVIDPKGERCYYAHPETASGGNLDVDITRGYGPETFTMARAIPGNYAVQIQYFSSGGAPVTRVHVYIILNEGTPEERVLRKTFVMTREHQVYQVASFPMGEDVIPAKEE